MILATLVLALGTVASPEPGPAVGSAIPAFQLRDQDGRLRTFADLAGPKGLVLVFFRSADW